MTRMFKTETPARNLEFAGSFYDAAVRVRELLNADYAVVATIQSGGLVIRALAGPGAEETLLSEVTSKLANWGPIVVDDSRFISVPAIHGNRVAAILIGCSTSPGRFTSDDLERLMAFSQDIAMKLDLANTVEVGLRESLLSETELLHISRLVTLGELSACFSHEVMNPLTSLKGYVRLIEQVIPEDDPIRPHLIGLQRNSKRIEDMAKTMLGFSRKRNRELESCKAEDLICEAVRFVQPRLQNPMIQLEVRVEDHTPQVVVERWQIVHALVNLLQNSIDAIDRSQKRQITVLARYEDGFVRFSVSDTGSGIPIQFVSRIFVPFFSTKGEQGNGLGLYITRRAVEEHRGTITLQTGENGSVFTICIPLKGVEESVRAV